MGDAQRAVVVGQGYVGLPLAVAAAEAGHFVVGVDRDKSRVDVINEGRSPVTDISDARLTAVLDSEAYRATADVSAIERADVVIVCVPTPYRDQAPDLSYVQEAAEAIGRYLQPGTLVVLESTTFPGTTEEFLQPLLEQGSGLAAGVDFDLAFSPERIDPGNPKYDIRNTPKIVGGVTAGATARASRFYGSFVDRVVEVSEPKAAEMAKLLENTFRHINIALANEIAIACRDLGIDVWEVIDAAASKPFGFMPFYPGPGVGGHCIPVDPMYLSWRLRQFGGSAKFVDLARDVNAAMPLYCATRVQDLLNEAHTAVNGARILVLGVAYKADVADVRESPALPLIVSLRRKGAFVDYHDPLVPMIELPDGSHLSHLEVEDAAIALYDCVVIVTPHAVVDYEPFVERAKVVFDTRNFLRSSAPNVRRL